MALDERLRRELERAARPADPSGVYEDLIRRKERRRIRDRFRTAGLGVVVLLGIGLGLAGLSRVFAPASHVGGGVSNGRIAFTNFEPRYAIPEVTAAWYVYTMRPDGTDVSFVGPRAVDEALFPAFSPDGRLLAFAGFTAEPEERALYVLDVVTGSVSKIHVLDRREQIDGLAWSPDGGRIGMLLTELVPTEPPPETGARDVDVASTIWTVAADGSDLRQVTTVGREGGFSWSPDGSRIVFSRHEPITTGSDTGTVGTDLYVIAADGAGETRLTDDGRSMSPAWSPDGRLIAFDGSGVDEGLDLYVMNAEGGGRRRLTSDPGNEFGPVWSPDGSTIAFAERAVTEDGGPKCFVTTIRADGSERSRLFGMPDEQGCPGANGISWAPGLRPEPTATLTSPAPTVEPTPDATSGVAGEDIGLGSRVCDVTSIPGEFAPGVEGTAYVATKVGEAGGCPHGEGAFHLVAVDVTGDGRADASYGPLECQNLPCSAFAAPDVDGDGTDELVVENVAFSIAGLRLYDVGADPPRVLPVTVSTPGYPEGGLPPGLEPQLWLGGDGFDLDELQCETVSGDRILVQTSASMVPPDSPDSVWRATETSFRLDPDGTVAIVGTRSFDEPVVRGGPSFWNPDDGVCGARVPYPYGAA